MSAQDSNAASLRDRQQLATREEIIGKAIELYSSGVELVSHELIASEAGMSSRTVYRHFPDRTALVTAIWLRLREMTGTRFPSTEDEIVPLAYEVFGSLEQHASLVNGVMGSVAAAQLLRLPATQSTESFSKSLGPLLEGIKPAERKKIVAIFVAIYSATFWQLLRERAGLSGKEIQESTVWLLDTLLDALHRNATQSQRKKKTK